MLMRILFANSSAVDNSSSKKTTPTNVGSNKPTRELTSGRCLCQRYAHERDSEKTSLEKTKKAADSRHSRESARFLCSPASFGAAAVATLALAFVGTMLAGRQSVLARRLARPSREPGTGRRSTNRFSPDRLVRSCPVPNSGIS
jgi:hypothetical protein